LAEADWTGNNRLKTVLTADLSQIKEKPGRPLIVILERHEHQGD
jgi:hypothetical protein